jgi:LysM repeat protein
MLTTYTIRKAVLFLASILFFTSIRSQVLTKEQYIEMFKDIAMNEMKRTGVPAAITLAQAILESENGNSDLTRQSNNHFGIKCKSNWSGPTVYHDDDARHECFRAYSNAAESFKDHSDFLKTGPRYSFLFQLDPTDYKKWAYGLKQAGYATNPQYPNILIDNIEKYGLQQYTLLAMNNAPKADIVYADDNKQQAVVTNVKYTIPNDPAPAVLHVKGEKMIINGCSAIWALKGTSLLAIAVEHNISLGRLAEYNDMEDDGLLKKDQLIFLQKKSKEGDRPIYITKEGESLFDIAQSNGIRLQSLCEYNLLHPNDVIKDGTKLYLKADKQKIAKSSGAALRMVHKVEPKEEVENICKKYGISKTQLKEWNNLKDDKLTVGQLLIVSN